MPSTEQSDFIEIQRVINDWVVHRDSLQFDQLLALWHEDGRMMTTWSQVSAVEFVRLSRAAVARGVQIQHLLGGSHVQIVGDRAVAQTKTTIAQRGSIDAVLCDATCYGRFYDLFERRSGIWKIVFRQPIYERDRLDLVQPGTAPILDQDLLASFPQGYRHLGYLQTKLGMEVKRDMPGLTGPEVEALYAQGSAWLEGGNAR
ncbi:nuclear transport factor 2 family protein [Sphingomonas sp. UYP23]